MCVGYGYFWFYRVIFIILGISCYFRNLDYVRLRKIVDDNGAYFMVDMVYISGLVAVGVVFFFFEYCYVVFIIIYKILRGCRVGMIFYRRGVFLYVGYRRGVGVCFFFLEVYIWFRKLGKVLIWEFLNILGFFKEFFRRG